MYCALAEYTCEDGDTLTRFLGTAASVQLLIAHVEEDEELEDGEALLVFKLEEKYYAKREVRYEFETQGGQVYAK